MPPRPVRFRRAWLSCAALALAFVAAPASADVFINEIHYDDATSSGDTGERIEVVATAGETLSAYRIYLYNGSTPSAAVTYDNDLVPAGSLVSCGAQVRIATVSYASNGIQNGPNDGIALVNPAGQVVQFILLTQPGRIEITPPGGIGPSRRPDAETACGHGTSRYVPADLDQRPCGNSRLPARW